MVCALHACGELHHRLLHQAETIPPAVLFLVPCCYHRTSNILYKPRSQVGRACQLSLTRDDLRLAVLETVTAGQAQRQAEQRRKHVLLALKAWGRRHGRELQDYKLLKDLGRMPELMGLKEACQRLDWPIPADRDISYWLEIGQAHARQIQALELIRTAIRRPLEVWLVLDLAQSLSEQGFSVQVGEFCAPHLTPRNLVIQAIRS